MVFTGIVQGKGRIQRVQRKSEFCTFDIEFPSGRLADVQVGGSIAINGTCLTVVNADSNVAQFDVIGESLKRTNLGLLEEGSPVNFERAARVGDEIGGHNVSGHVHTTATIVRDPEWMKYILEKGFISVDGCSLTVGEVTDSTFSVYLIPETLRVTVLGDKGEGDVVNIEVETQTQAIVDTVERVMQQFLAKKGLA
ncbi:hypothetical protein N2152v2_007095 [Parachlorella kessleri]